MAEKIKTALLAVHGSKCQQGIRAKHLHALADVIEKNKEDLPPKVVTVILQQLTTTLPLFSDRQSRFAALRAVQVLSKKHPDQTYTSFLSLLPALTKEYKKTTVGAATTAHLSLLTWVAEIVKNVDKYPDFSKLVTFLCPIVSAASKEDTKVCSKSLQTAHSIVASVKDGPTKVVESMPKEPTMEHISLCSVATDVQLKNEAVFSDKLKDQLVTIVTKTAFSAKLNIPEGILKRASLVQVMSHDDITNKLLPAIDRSLKRNVEISLNALQFILSPFTIDLSRHAEKLITMVVSNLSSSKDTVRLAAVGVVSQLATKCCDSAALQSLLDTLGKAYFGKHGNVGQVQQRKDILAAVGGVESSGRFLISTGKVALAEKAFSVFTQIFEKEQNEDALAECLRVYSLYISLVKEVPESVVSKLNEMLTSKKTKPKALCAALECIFNGFKGERASSISGLFDAVKVTFEKFAKQNNVTSQTNMLLAAAVMNRSASANGEENKLSAEFWGLFVSGAAFDERFFEQASTNTILAFSELAIALLMSPKAKENGVDDASRLAWHNGIILCGLTGTWEARKPTLAGLKRYLESQTSLDVSRELLSLFMKQQEKFHGSEESPSPVHFVTLLATLSTPPSTTPPVDLMPHLILPSFLVQKYKKCFQLLCKKNDVKLSDLYVSKAKEIADILSVYVHADQPAVFRTAAQTAISAIVGHESGLSVMNILVDEAVTTFKNPEVGRVSGYMLNIYRTKEGELYDEDAVFGDATTSYVEDKNAKDYADKKWAEEVKRELAKKRGEKVSDRPKMTPKQKELYAVQIEKETAIRKEVGAVEVLFDQHVTIINACVRGNAQALRPMLPKLSAALDLLKSPLTSERAGLLWVALAQCVSPRLEDLSKSIAFVVLHSKKSAHSFTPNWKGDTFTNIVSQIMRSLWEVAGTTPLDDVSFAFCFPLMEYILMYSSAATSVMEDAMVVLGAHSIHGKSANILRVKFLELIKHVIENHSRLAHQAVVLMQSLASSMGEAEFPMTSAEIDIFRSALVAPQKSLRKAALESLGYLKIPIEDNLFVANLWLASHDPEVVNSQLALDLWTENSMMLAADILPLLLDPLMSRHVVIRAAAAKSLGGALKIHLQSTSHVVSLLLQRFNDSLKAPPMQRDAVGNIIHTKHIDPWEGRVGIAEGMAAMASVLTPDDISTLFEFFVSIGLADSNESVRDAVRDAGVKIIDEKGKEHIDVILPVLERFLTDAATTAENDVIRHSVVILLGSVAQHLDKTDQKIPQIVETLLDTLPTPAEAVQSAVSKCLPPLVAGMKDKGPELIKQQLDELFGGERFANRRGAAFGLAGIIKGLGILALKQQGVMDILLEAIQNKKSPLHREGALMAFELLCLTIGRMFEPYVIKILPHLLNCYGDGNKDVRAATVDTSKAIMSKLSGHGVKMVLPSLLQGLNDTAWRTKQGSAELLGAMAFCAPKQLSACLPNIVPPLSEVLSDSHAKVQKAGREALSQIGSVIKNPEIQEIADVILAALNDPTTKTKACLTTMLETAFVHVIDAPSLALIMPILERALRDRSTENKKSAAQIIGNMYSLTDPKDLQSYLPKMLPGLKDALVDPLPDVRGVAAKALGAMMKGMGENSFPDLVPWLLETLRSDASVVDRSGAAQGLSEVLAALGAERMASMLDDFIAATQHPAPHIREGHFMLLVYLPITFGDAFQPYVESIIPSVLKGLADIEETVRDASYRCGQRIVSNYADTSVELLLPQLEFGLTDENWRIRQSSLQLLGDLLFKLSGMSGKKSTEGGEDENFGTEQARVMLLEALGEERRNRVLSAVYMARQDTSLGVRQTGVHVWKVVVAHTVRTLRDILQSLVSMLLGCLASESRDKRTVAAKTLGELVRKLGERVLPDIFPILEAGLDSDDPNRRQGVCVGLSEIMNSTSSEVMQDYIGSLIPAVRRAICDQVPAVRETAAQTFVTLHSKIGGQAVDEIIPELLRGLESDDTSVAALDGLSQIMTSNSKIVLPFLVPRLIEQPISAFNARAIASLSSVAGPALAKYIPTILAALLEVTESPDSTKEMVSAAKKAAQDMALSVSDAGSADLIQDVVNACRSTKPSNRVMAVEILQAIAGSGNSYVADHRATLINTTLSMLVDENAEVVHAAWGAVGTVLSNVGGDQFSALKQVHQSIKSLKVPDSGLVPGFCIPRGLEKVCPLYLTSLLNGSPEAKVFAAGGLGLLVSYTSADALKPFVIKITGPLIRVLGEHTPALKAASLHTLNLLLEKCNLKTFVPQLQPTCLKVVKDGNKLVRTRAGLCITNLISLVRDKGVDRFMKDLSNDLLTLEPPVQETVLKTMNAALDKSGMHVTGDEKKKLISALWSLVEGADTPEESRVSAADALGAFSQHFADDEFVSFCNQHLFTSSGGKQQKWLADFGQASLLGSMFRSCAEKLLTLAKDKSESLVKRLLTSENAFVIGATCKGIVNLLPFASSNSDWEDFILGKLLAKAMKALDNLGNSDVQQDFYYRVEDVAKRSSEPFSKIVLQSIVPRLSVDAVKKSGTLKMNAENALVYVLHLHQGNSLLKTVEDSNLEGLFSRVLQRRTQELSANPNLPVYGLKNEAL